MPQPSDQRHPRILKWITPLLSTLLGLAILEVLLVLLHPVPHFSPHNMYFEPDPHTGYRLRPNSVGRFGVDPGEFSLARANSHGHRDHETTLEKPDGTLRVLALGDSMTFGANVRLEEAYPQVLEGLLNQRFEVPMEVVSSGVGGWAPFQYAQYYEHYGHRFEPDLVVVGFFVGNDTFTHLSSPEELPTAIRGQRAFRGIENPTATALKIELYERFHVFRLFLNGRRFVITAEDLRVDPREPRDTDRLPKSYLALQLKRLPNHLERSEHRERLARNGVAQLARIKQLADRASIPLVVVLMPDENQVNSSLRRKLLPADSMAFYDFSMPQTMLIEILDKEGIRTLDLLDRFLAAERRLFMNDGHFRPEGHRITAEALLEEIAPLIRADQRSRRL